MNDKWTEKKIRETLPFTITTNNIKYLGITSTKPKDLYDKKCKSLNEKIEEYNKNGKTSHARE